jgi:hypothetical protein
MGLLAPTTIGGSASLVTLEVREARGIGAAMVAAGATVVVPIEDRPYGRCEGRIADPFGLLWIPTHETARIHAPAVRRIVADLAVTEQAATAQFYTQLLGLEIFMDLGWVVTLGSPTHHATQLTLIHDDATGRRTILRARSVRQRHKRARSTCRHRACNLLAARLTAASHRPGHPP